MKFTLHRSRTVLFREIITDQGQIGPGTGMIFTDFIGDWGDWWKDTMECRGWDGWTGETRWVRKGELNKQEGCQDPGKGHCVGWGGVIWDGGWDGWDISSVVRYLWVD